MKRCKLRCHVCLIFFSLGLIAPFLSGCKPAEEPVRPLEKVTIAYSTKSNAILVYIAFVKGYFREEGVDAIPQPHPLGKKALDAVIAGKADLATAADTPIMFAIMNGKKITVLATIQSISRNAVVARRDRGVSAPADLKGKRIGVTLGTSGHFFLESFLVVHGIDKNEVTLVNMIPDEMYGAIGAGTVDAVSTWHTMMKKLLEILGGDAVVFFGETLYTETFCLAANQDYVRMHPGAVKKVLRALVRAEDFVQQKPEESRSLVAEFIQVDRSFLDEAWDAFTFRLALDQALVVNFEDQTRWAIKNGLTARTDMPDYLDFIYVDGLQSVKPDAVRIIR